MLSLLCEIDDLPLLVVELKVEAGLVPNPILCRRNTPTHHVTSCNWRSDSDAWEGRTFTRLPGYTGQRKYYACFPQPGGVEFHTKLKVRWKEF